MKQVIVVGIVGLIISAAGSPAKAQVAGSTISAFAFVQTEELAVGWSAKKQFLGRAIYNESGHKVGVVDDLIIAPDSSVSIAIVGGLGLGGKRRHQVAIPVSLLSQDEGNLILPGATRDLVKSLPQFKYSREALRAVLAPPGASAH